MAPPPLPIAAHGGAGRLREEVSAAAVKVGVLGTTLTDLKWVATLHVGETGHSGMVRYCAHALGPAPRPARTPARAQVEHTNGKRLTLKVESKKKLGAIGAQVRALVRARLCAMLRIPFRHATVATQDRAVMEKKTQLKLSSARVRCAQPPLCP